MVDSIRRVTHLISEIGAASVKQSAGVAQVGETVSQMDQTTQQNAALVEEIAATSTELSGQARELVEAVAVFRIAAGARAAELPVSRLPARATPSHETPPVRQLRNVA